MQVPLTLIGVTHINPPAMMGEKTPYSARIQVLMITCQMALSIIITRKSRRSNFMAENASKGAVTTCSPTDQAVPQKGKWHKMDSLNMKS